MARTNRHDDYIAKLRTAIVQAICEASVPEADPITGNRADTLYIGSAEVCDALIILLAEFVDGVPGLNTPTDINVMSETVARKLRASITAIRDHRAKTGTEPPQSIIIQAH